MDRRNFTKLCSQLIAGASALSLSARQGVASETAATASNTGQDTGTPVKLVHSNGLPVTPESLTEGESYIFHYPYKTTPCFLIRLKAATDAGDAGKQEEPVNLLDRNGQAYQWRGGVGPNNEIVAFSAICTHKMSHPARPISHLNFRPEQKVYFDRGGEKQTASQLIYCCSEHSVYNPSEGARVLSGPATQPLAAINLSVSTQNTLLATGIYGGDMLQDFLDKFGFRQAMEQGVSDPFEASDEEVMVVPAEEYSSQRVLC